MSSFPIRMQASSWLEWAATTAAAPELAWLAGEAPVIRIMLNVGARHTAPQVAAAAKAAGLDHIVAKIDAAVGSGSLVSGGSSISALDVAVATTLYDVLALLFPPAVVGSAYPSYAKWFAAVVSSPAVAPVLRKLNLVTGGVVREGGQIDVRASPVVVAALADRSIALNAGHKKAESQRAAEDAAKAKEGAAAAKSPAAAGAGAAAAPSSSSSAAAAPAAPAASAEAIAAQGAANRAFAAQSSDARIAAGEATLSKAGVPYSLLKHAPAMTVDELLAALGPENASGACKNLLVKAKKEKAAGDSRVWLVVALHNTKVSTGGVFPSTNIHAHHVIPHSTCTSRSPSPSDPFSYGYFSSSFSSWVFTPIRLSCRSTWWTSRSASATARS